MGVGGQGRESAALPSGKARYSLHTGLGGPQGPSGRIREVSPPPGLAPRTVCPVPSCYTDWAILAVTR